MRRACRDPSPRHGLAAEADVVGVRIVRRGHGGLCASPSSPHGTIIFMFGMARTMAISSIAWCVAPSGPTLIPPCAPPIFTGRSLYAP